MPQGAERLAALDPWRSCAAPNAMIRPWIAARGHRAGGRHIDDAIWRHTITRVGDTCVVGLHGELDMSNCQELADILTRELDRPGVSNVCADLTHVGFIDSSGIEALMTGYRHAQAARRSFKVTGTRGHVHSVLNISGVLAVLS